MFQRILIVVDLTAGTQSALDYGIGLARTTGADVHVCAVAPLPTVAGTIDEIREQEEDGRAALGPILRRARLYAEQQGQPVTTELLAGKPDETILRVVLARAIDLVVVGQHGESLDAAWRHLVHKAPCPVFVARETVVQKFDGSPGHRTSRWEVRRDHRDRIEGKGRMLRVFIGEDDSRDGRPVYELILERLREMDMAGATVYRGVMGFGAGHRLRTARRLPWSHDRPMVVTAVDTDAAIQRAVERVQDLVAGGLIVTSAVEIIRYLRRPVDPHLPAVERRASD
jgi:PII-like signaling protein/nucleotide-binding universal stress UspA family protein